MQCYIDCRVDERLSNDFLNLSLWGKPCYSYVIDAVTEAGVFDDIHVVTENQKIKDYCEHIYRVDVTACFDELNEKAMFISGRAPLISPATIKGAVACGGGYCSISKKSYQAAN